MELEFDVKVNSKVLYDYMLHHTYGSFQGVLGTAVGALMLVGFVTTGYLIWLIAGVVLLVYFNIAPENGDSSSAGIKKTSTGTPAEVEKQKQDVI